MRKTPPVNRKGNSSLVWFISLCKYIILLFRQPEQKSLSESSGSVVCQSNVF